MLLPNDLDFHGTATIAAAHSKFLSRGALDYDFADTVIVGAPGEDGTVVANPATVTGSADMIDVAAGTLRS